MITYEELKEKFTDKGMLPEFYMLVIPAPPFDINRKLSFESVESAMAVYEKTVESVYGTDWEHWNTWIDHQNYK